MTPGSPGKRSTRTPAPPTPIDSGQTSVERDESLALRSLLGLLADQVRLVVDDRREVDANPDDAFRGLYVTEDDVQRLLKGGWPTPEAGIAAALKRRAGLEAAIADGSTRLSGLVTRFMLAPLDLSLLLVALAPDLDARFERLYGYLNDDVTKRRASVGLALALCGEPASVALGRTRFAPGAPLVAGGLVLVEEADRPLLTRSLRVPDRVVNHLLGDDSAEPEITRLLTGELPSIDVDAKPLSRAIEQGSGLVYLRERPGSAGRLLAVKALFELGEHALSLDLSRLEPGYRPLELATAIARDARLRGGGVVAGPIDALGDSADARALIRALSEMPVLVALLGRQTWDPQLSNRVPLVIDAPIVTKASALSTWVERLESPTESDEAILLATSSLLLAPEQIVRAVSAARQHSVYVGDGIGLDHIRHGALAQNAAGLERLARRIEPSASFDDLVLPANTLRLLHEVVGRVRDRDVVIGEWHMRPGSGRGRGVTALFAGESGTGKTMAAEVIAHALGIELYTINLATVVDKYVGETEKNLERIFSEASGVNGVLLFDEADALFGKRSEVKDAHDRYANIEVAYLLQRIESFDGLALLSTNLRANVDEAFTRRFDAVIDFPSPNATQRRELWRLCLGDVVPQAPDVDLDFLASSFELTGGNIRSIALTAAYMAAAGDGEVTMSDLVRAVHREYRKLGRLSVRAEFGPYFEMIADESGSGWDDRLH